MKFKAGMFAVCLLLLLTGCEQNSYLPPASTTPPAQQTPEKTEAEQQQEAQQIAEQQQQEAEQQQQAEQQEQQQQQAAQEQQQPQVVSRELARYGSEMTNKKKNRLKNIRLAIEQVNGYVMESGETISFNKLVGPTTPERGFAKATVYIDGEETEGYGGGICQLSSTLYNAAMEAGLEIVERHPHKGGTVHYVPAGRDATVSYGGVDLKVKNTKPFPVKIYASMDENGVYVALKSIEQNG